MRQSRKSVLRFAILSSLTIAGLALNSAANAACTITNTCYGAGALPNDTGDNNSAFGYQALFNSTSSPTIPTGGLNTAIGSQTLQANTTGQENTAVGFQSMASNLTSSENTAVGTQTLFSNTLGYLNTAVGYQTMFNNTTGRINTAVGMQALNANTTGELNVAIGDRTLYYNKSGELNTAVGHYALHGGGPNKLTGSNSTAIGALALFLNTSGNDNTATGANALFNNSVGNSNSAVGLNAMYENTTGANNSALGVGALKNNATGVRNVAIGYQAGFKTTGSDNIVIGASSQAVAAENGVIRIGTKTFQKKTFVAGIAGVKTGLATATTVFIDANGQLGTIKSSREYKEDIQPMGSVSERLMSLRPVAFRYKEHEEDGSQPVQYGLIAEEVAEEFPELVVYDQEGKPETVAYHLLATLLLNEFQKAHGVIETQATRIAALEAQSAELALLKQDLAKMAAIVERLNHAAMVATAR